MNDWGRYGFEYEHIARFLAGQPTTGEVTIVFPPERGPRGKPISIRSVSGNLHLLTPNNGTLPLSRYRTVGDINLRIAAWRLGEHLRSLRFRTMNTVLWLYPPHRFIPLLRRWAPHGYTVAQIVDNNTLLENISAEEKRFIRNQYAEIASGADMVTTASRSNFEFFSGVNPNCRMFENAVDPAFLARPSPLPSRLSRCRPRLGYVGWITQRTDIRLLDTIARSRPQCDLFIAGPSEVDLNALGTLSLPNVTYMGPIGYGEVPSFLESLDVCLIPHKDTPYSRTMNPLKVYQYLASGRPVVTSNVAGVERFHDLFAVARDDADFLDKIDEALSADTPEQSAKRIEAARRETWEIRLPPLLRTIRDDFRRKRAGMGIPAGSGPAHRRHRHGEPEQA